MIASAQQPIDMTTNEISTLGPAGTALRPTSPGV
jgi:hypothetical protein